MPSNRYYHDEGTLTVTIGGSDITIGEARGVTITPQAEHNRFYGPDSVEFQEVKRSQFQVNVEIEVAEFDEDFVQYWLDGTADPGSGGTKATSINDNNNVLQANVTSEQPMSSNDFKLKNVAYEVDFPEIPAMDTTEGEYVSHSISGVGRGLELTNVSV